MVVKKLKSLWAKLAVWATSPSKPMREDYCEVCGGLYIFGLDAHAPCREIRRRRTYNYANTGPK